MPIAHKDLLETADIRTTAGSRPYAQHVPRADAVLVSALARAGTVLLGKTNTHELGGGVTTINSSTYLAVQRGRCAGRVRAVRLRHQGLPVGLQLVSGAHREALLWQVARQVDAATNDGGPKRPG